MNADPLRAAGLKRTAARVAVLAAVERVERPVSHAELRATPPLSELDEITLYRTLATLESAGLLHRVYGIDGTWRYSANRAAAGCPGNHVHFLCTGCGEMRCLDDQPMPRVEVPAGATVDGRHFLVFGRCPTCNHSGEP